MCLCVRDCMKERERNQESKSVRDIERQIRIGGCGDNQSIFRLTETLTWPIT